MWGSLRLTPIIHWNSSNPDTLGTQYIHCQAARLLFSGIISVVGVAYCYD